MTCIHGNKVNNISEFSLLHDIINPPRLTKINKQPLLSYYTWMYEYKKG